MDRNLLELGDDGSEAEVSLNIFEVEASEYKSFELSDDVIVSRSSSERSARAQAAAGGALGVGVLGVVERMRPPD